MAVVTCQYCGQREAGSGSRCAHCGAPLPEAPSAGGVPATGSAPHSDRTATTPGPLPHAHGPGNGPVAGGKSRLRAQVESAVPRNYPRWQWRVVTAVLVGAVVLLVILVSRSCALSIPDMGGPGGFGNVGQQAGDPVDALPATLRNGSSCRAAEGQQGAQVCMASAAGPLLFGDVTSGQDLTFKVQQVPAAHLRKTMDQWRSAGGTKVSDGEVFATITASSSVLYADTRSGIRLDTARFANQSGAQTFLARSGLLQ